MSNSILYYPTIEFRKQDYEWLWGTSLFADKVYRIVPPGYELKEPRNITALCSNGDIGIPISPVKYSTEASREFSEFVEKNKRKAAALTLIEEGDTEYIRIVINFRDFLLLGKSCSHKNPPFFVNFSRLLNRENDPVFRWDCSR